MWKQHQVHLSLPRAVCCVFAPALHLICVTLYNPLSALMVWWLSHCLLFPTLWTVHLAHVCGRICLHECELVRLCGRDSDMKVTTYFILSKKEKKKNITAAQGLKHDCSNFYRARFIISYIGTFGVRYHGQGRFRPETRFKWTGRLLNKCTSWFIKLQVTQERACMQEVRLSHRTT